MIVYEFINMKFSVANTILALAASLTLAGCSGNNAPSPAETLKERLQAVVSDGKFVYFHQDDLVYGHTWKVEDVDGDDLQRSDVKSVCGQFPGGVGFDLGGIELGDTANLDGVPFDLMRRAAVTHYGRGGLVTFSWHPRNPLTGGDTWDISSDKAVASVLEGGENHGKFMDWLSKAADFLGSLKDSEGGLIPVIFRPWHENLGSWFWWGGKLCTADEYKALYSMTHKYLTEEKGLTNLVWAYSPNSGLTEESFYGRYPGDDIVDIIGVDHYDYVAADSTKTDGQRFAEANDHYLKVLRSDLALLSGIADRHGKLLALCETGFEGIPDASWWTDVLLEGVKGVPVCYVLTWRNAWDKPGHFFAPFPESGDSGNFEEFFGNDRTIFIEQEIDKVLNLN